MNKNTKLRQTIIRRAVKKAGLGNPDVKNDTTLRYTTSVSETKNVQMRIYHPVAGGSITRFYPRYSDKPAYRRDSTTAARVFNAARFEE